MKTDKITTVTSLVTAVVAVLTYYKFIPSDLSVPFIALGVAIVGYFTNK
jgi:hypothetical protein